MSRAAPRDASWYRNPNVSGFKAVHVDDGDEFAKCDSHMMLGSTIWEDAADVPEGIRCRRAACRIAFELSDNQATEARP